MGDASDFVRLHISPLDAELVKVVIPAAVLPSARNISYHTLETFPERRYGFVDLPAEDAEKLRRKLNGTTLKGCKMRVEKARPETRIEPTGAEDAVVELKRKKAKDDKDKSKKRKREPDVLEGVALHDRHVKRGWTEPPTTNKRKNRKDKEGKDKDKAKEKEKKKRPKSKYTEGEECLLKTKLPPNTIKNLAPEELEHKKRSKKKGSSSRQVVIHEFEKTTKFPSFLKTSTTTDRKPAAEFVEGKGWVDEEGNLVEEVKEKEKEKKKKLPQRPKKAPLPKKTPVESDDDDSTSSSGTSSEGTSSEDEDESEAESEADTKSPVKKETTKKEAAEVPSEEQDTKQKDQSSKATDQATPPSSSKTPASKSTPQSTKPLAIKIPPPETPTNSNTKVHPLEALYKRPKPDGNSSNNDPTSAPKEAEPFSFFGAADDEDIDEETPSGTTAASAPAANLAPMTPFTRQDFEWRNVRSAAPTPDTAHPSRAQRFWGASPDDDEDAEMEDDGQEDEDDDDDDDEGEANPAQGRQSATTDFQKWFWENRRDLNRSWMTRRKTAAKEKRHRENKARASKAV
ncbi:uncharacterized protein TRIREDRAFT_61307 [Trichoderma reesei QM6a]|uniref:Predicted protein n=2 Tax=Hypocrea jecorina TaxID=51453 RepID=G0RIQ2_HYPJQ|nr:uncharacterized protein TRIREDRAFT_61307 [Trichoderma reesei QM6a]EGR49045.1 predicted protein [Trichoderma reesei QM6a]ETS02279.1 hypothetical protein M419DRAFT_77545 [Trichoderma reesei RUT C-30]